VLVAELYAVLNDRFPFINAPSWDPVGLQLGDMDQGAGAVAVCHEVTVDVVESAISGGVATLVSYHPLLFDPVTAIVAGRSSEGRALRLVQSGVSLIVVHTAMDVAPGGTANALLASLGIATTGSFASASDEAEHLIGRFGPLISTTTAGSLAELMGEQLSARVQIAGDQEAIVKSLAAVPGSGGSFIDEASEVADAYVTGDIGHHQAQSAIELGLTLFDAGHIPTERPGVAHLYDAVRDVVSDAVFIASDPHPWEDVSWKT
jgi:dinuclear metal center YbgI/SA1388 family protein